MRPCLVLLIVTTCFASPFAFAQRAGSHAAPPASTPAALPAATDPPTAPSPRSQSAFGRAMAELTRAARESRQTARVETIDEDSGGDRSSAATAKKGQGRNAVVAKSTRSEP